MVVLFEDSAEIFRVGIAGLGRNRLDRHSGCGQEVTGRTHTAAGEKGVGGHAGFGSKQGVQV